MGHCLQCSYQVKMRLTIKYRQFYFPSISRDASDKMNNVINARLRLVQQLGHLSGALSITVAGNEGANGLYNKLNAGFSGCVDTIKIGVENEVKRRIRN